MKTMAIRRHTTRLLILATGTVVVATGSAATAAPSTALPTTVRTASCAHPGSGRAGCYVEIEPPAAGARAAATSPRGLGPAEIAAAYRMPKTTATGATVTIVDAYDDPNAEADLAAYRKQFGLSQCTTANGCFRKLNQRGDTGAAPLADAGWALEISLDLDAASAACPGCKITLVEADSPSFNDLGASVNAAARLGAKVISNSYGGAEDGSALQIDRKYYRHPGVSVVASSGDSGFGPASVPAAFTGVIAAGGTTLSRDAATPRGWDERAWSGAGSGCSAYVGKPAWQKDTHCTGRTVADISAVADPATGLAVYDTYDTASQGFRPGWITLGGTSLSSPLISAMIARSGHVLDGARTLYSDTENLFDPVGGSTGFCGNDYLCTGKRGYDAPTGVGSPRGVGAL